MATPVIAVLEVEDLLDERDVARAIQRARGTISAELMAQGGNAMLSPVGIRIVMIHFTVQGFAREANPEASFAALVNNHMQRLTTHMANNIAWAYMLGPVVILVRSGNLAQGVIVGVNVAVDWVQGPIDEMGLNNDIAVLREWIEREVPMPLTHWDINIMRPFGQ